MRGTRDQLMGDEEESGEVRSKAEGLLFERISVTGEHLGIRGSSRRLFT